MCSAIRTTRECNSGSSTAQTNVNFPSTPACKVFVTDSLSAGDIDSTTAQLVIISSSGRFALECVYVFLQILFGCDATSYVPVLNYLPYTYKYDVTRRERAKIKVYTFVCVEEQYASSHKPLAHIHIRIVFYYCTSTFRTKFSHRITDDI